MTFVNKSANELHCLTIVISVYNEEEVLPVFIREVNRYINSLPIKLEFIFVNDGSTDQSVYVLNKVASENDSIKIINLSRNYGHEAAMIAGIDYSSGEAVICMDADLQHPLSKIEEMVDKYLQGYEIVNMVRTENRDVGIIKSMTSNLLYWVLNLISSEGFEPNASDFFLV